MAFGGHYVLNKGFQANEAITQFRFVKLGTGSRNVDICDTAGEAALGVCQEEITAADATNGRIANVAILGISLVESGAAVSAGAKVQTDASGRAIAALTGDHVLGVALDAAGGAGEWIAVLLSGGGQPILA